MYWAILAVVGAVGSWGVWTRNPLYSAGKTWRMLGGMGLGIAAFVALDVLVVNLTIHRSPWVAGSSMGMLILSAVIGIFLIARAFTKPEEQALPAGIPAVTVHRKVIGIWAKRAGIAIIAFGVLGLMLPGNFKILGWMLGGFVAFFAAFLLPIGYITARDKDRALTGVEVIPWVHWQFSEEQWNLMTAVEVQRAKVAAVSTFRWKAQWKTMAFTLLLMGLMARFETSSWLMALVVCGGVVAFIALLVGLTRLDARKVPGRTERKMAKAGRDAYFADGGLFWEGGFSPWVAMDLYLVAASIDEHGPRSLVLDFEKVVSGRTGSSIYPVQQRVLIPDGAEGDVRTLQDKLAVKCPKAAVRIC